MSNDIGGVWRTVGGRKIFIKDGEDLQTAMKKSGKFGNQKDSDNEADRKKQIENYSDDLDEAFYTISTGEYDDETLRKGEKALRKISQDKSLEREVNKYLKENEYEFTVSELKEAYRDDLKIDIKSNSSPTEKSISSLNEIDRLAGDSEYLQKKGRELGLNEFKKFLKDNPGYLKKKK